MRGPLTWIIGIAVGLVLVLVVTGAIGHRNDREDTVTAGEWAQNVCGTVGVWRGELKSIVEDVRTPSAVAPTGEEPQSETPQGRTGLRARRAGPRPSSPQTLSLRASTTRASPIRRRARKRTSRYPTGRTRRRTTSRRRRTPSTRSPTPSRSRSTRWREQRGHVRTALTSGVQTIASVARLDPALAAALRESSNCKQLREEDELDEHAGLDPDRARRARRDRVHRARRALRRDGARSLGRRRHVGPRLRLRPRSGRAADRARC